MATYIFINSVYMLSVYLFFGRRLTRRVDTLARKPWYIMAAIMFVLTLVFDALLIAYGMFWYEPPKILGVRLLGVPIEDFCYTFVAVTLLPLLWTYDKQNDL